MAVSGELVNRGLYIHIPFCIRKCSYCDFYSVPLRSPAVLERYIRAIEMEIQIKALSFPNTRLKTVYLGGGTPSILEGDQLKRIISAVGKYFILDKSAEICLEANPAALDADKIKAILEAGFNRISIGVQSFNDEDLHILGRSHSAGEALDTIMLIKDSGINSCSIDLIYGIPGQTIKRWEDTLETAVKTGTAHISMYLLQLDENTSLAHEINKGRLELPGEESEAEMYYKGIEILESNGLNQYEISNFARPGFECQHNLLYWKAREYIGIGAGAVSFTDKRRYLNSRCYQDYQSSIENAGDWPVEELENMNQFELASDAIILGLRLCEGINIQQFKLRFGMNIYDHYKNIIEEFKYKGLLNLDNGNLKLTRKAYFISNGVICYFIA